MVVIWIWWEFTVIQAIIVISPHGGHGPFPAICLPFTTAMYHYDTHVPMACCDTSDTCPAVMTSTAAVLSGKVDRSGRQVCRWIGI